MDDPVPPEPQAGRWNRISRALIEPTPAAGESGLRANLRRVSLAAVTLLALAVGLFRIGVPSPWVDEAVTTLVVRRPWAGVTALLQGADAPLVPYYLLAKAWAGAFGWLPTLVAVRSLSAVASAITVAALFTLVARWNGIRTALLAALLLTSLAGFSRYAQEARPYALLIMTATLSWLAWDGWRRPAMDELRRPGSIGRTLGGAAAYLVSLVGSVLFHLFGLFQWPAQVVADLATPGLARKERVHRALLTAAAMVVVGVIAAYPLYFAATHGTGAPRVVRLTLTSVKEYFLQAVNSSPHLIPSLPFLALGAIGVVAVAARLRLARAYTRLVVVSLLWVAIPMLLSIAAAAVRPSLLRPRYWMPVVVPLSALAAVGTLVLVDAVWHLVRGRGVVPAARKAVAVIAGVAVLVAVAVVQVISVRGSQASIREQNGHALSLAPALAKLDAFLESEPDLPVTTTPNTRTTVVWAMRPEFIKDDVLFRLDETANTVWPTPRDAADVAQRLEGHNTVIWVRAAIMGTSITNKIKPKVPPKALEDLGFTLVSAQHAGSWWVCILQREE